MTALTDTIEAALRDAQAPTTSLRWYAETAARAVEPLIRAHEAAALERAEEAAIRHRSKIAVNEPLWHEGQDWAAERISDAIRALPRDGSALDAVVAARTARLREALAEALPWVEAQLDDPANKPGAVRAVANRIRATLDPAP